MEELEQEQPQPETPAEPALSVDELMASRDEGLAAPSEAVVSQEDTQLRAVLEAIIYVAEEPLTLAQNWRLPRRKVSDGYAVIQAQSASRTAYDR